MMRALLDRSNPAQQNVGGADFVTRLLASLVLAGMLYLVLPITSTGWSPLKIALLTAAELGLIIVMIGLFLRAKTYFAGAQLFLTPLLMLWLASVGFAWVALFAGAASLAWGITDLVTRKSRFNAWLGISTFREPLPTPPLTPHPHPHVTH